MRGGVEGWPDDSSPSLGVTYRPSYVEPFQQLGIVVYPRISLATAGFPPCNS